MERIDLVVRHSIEPFALEFKYIVLTNILRAHLLDLLVLLLLAINLFFSFVLIPTHNIIFGARNFWTVSTAKSFSFFNGHFTD